MLKATLKSIIGVFNEFYNSRLKLSPHEHIQRVIPFVNEFH